MINTQRRRALEVCRKARTTFQPLHRSLHTQSASKPRPVEQHRTAHHHASPLHHTPQQVSIAREKSLKPLPKVQCVVRARIPTTNGTEMFLHLYTNDQDNKEHLAIVFGDFRSKSLDAVRPDETENDRLIRGACSGPQCSNHIPLVRIHSECYTGETVWSARCDCGEQLDQAAHVMGSHGIIIYLRQEGRGIGLGEKLKAYNLQDQGADTVEANLLLNHPADARSYEVAIAMLYDLGQKEIRLLTNNPEKVSAIEGHIVVKERVPMVPLAWTGKGERGVEVDRYLKTKIEKMSHML